MHEQYKPPPSGRHERITMRIPSEMRVVLLEIAECECTKSTISHAVRKLCREGITRRRLQGKVFGR